MGNDILIVDDDYDLSEIVAMFLEDKDYTVRVIGRASMVKQAIEDRSPDLILLDIEIPDGDGFDICNQIRQCDEEVPIIFLSSHIDEQNRIRSFETGGNDFLGKPFSLEELYLRIEARLRDKHRLKQRTVFQVGELLMDAQKEILSKGGQTIRLTATEIKILKLFVMHPGKIYSEKEIFSEIWEETYNQDTRMVNVHISNLRKKIEKVDPSHKYIQTIWGKGYQYAG